MRPASPSLSLSSLRPLQSAGSMDSGSTFQSLPFTILLQELLRGRVCHARQQAWCLSYSHTLSFPSRVGQDLGKLIEMALILMSRHLLENMLEVHLAFVSALHHHPADDRSVRVLDEKGEIKLSATRLGASVKLEQCNVVGIVTFSLKPSSPSNIVV